MKKVELPIEKNREDFISPLKPDFKWLFKMIVTIVLTMIILYTSVVIFSKVFIENITIEKEKEFFGQLFLNGNEEEFNKKSLGENIGELENFNIYIDKNSIPNAYATLGANIIVTKGLLDNIKTKEELLFILGHEMAHIKNRDVIRKLSQNMPFTLFLNFLGIDFGNTFLSSNTIINNYFSRQDEKNADKGGLEYVNGLGKNAKCAKVFFEELETNNNKFFEFMQTHPVNPDRISFIEKNNKFGDKKCEKFEYKK